MTEPNNTSLLSALGEKLVDVKDTVVAAATGVEPVNRNAPEAPEAPAVAPATAGIPEGEDLSTKVAEAHDRLQNKPMYIPPAKPEQQLMMDAIHNLGVRELGRDLFYYRQYFTEAEIAECWKEFEPKNEQRVTVGELVKIGGRKAEFDEVRQALAGRSPDHTLSFSQFLGLLKEARGLDKNRENVLHRETIVQDSASGIHGNTEEERRVLMHFVNLLLERDDTVSGILPLDDKSPVVFQEFADGGLFCKLINRIKPGTIEEDKFHFGEGLHFLQLVDNHVISLKAAHSIGANTETIDPKGLIHGEARHVLAYLEQLFRLTFGCGSRQYNEEEHDRQAGALAQGEGLLGKPTAPGYFIPAEHAQPRDASEAALTAAEHTVPTQEGLSLLENEVERARAAAQRAQEHLASVERSYQQARQVQPIAEPQYVNKISTPIAAHSPIIESARSAPLGDVLATFSPVQTRALHPAPAIRSSFSAASPLVAQSPVIAPSSVIAPASQGTVVVDREILPPASTSVFATETPAAAAVAPVATAQPIKRAGEALVKGILRWKKRYIALDNNWMHLYKNSGVTNSGKHSINLAGATITRDTEASKDFAIFVSNPTQGEKAHLAFNNAAIMNDWLKDLAASQQSFVANPATAATTATTAPVQQPFNQAARPLSGTSSLNNSTSSLNNSGSNFYQPQNPSTGFSQISQQRGIRPVYNSVGQNTYQNRNFYGQPSAYNYQSQPVYNGQQRGLTNSQGSYPGSALTNSQGSYPGSALTNSQGSYPGSALTNSQGSYPQQQIPQGYNAQLNQLNSVPLQQPVQQQPTSTFIGGAQSGFTRVTYSDQPMGAPKMDFSDSNTLREFGLQHLVQPK